MADYQTPDEIKQYIEQQKALFEAGAIGHKEWMDAQNNAKAALASYTQTMNSAKGVMLKGALGLAEGLADGKKGAEAFNGAIDSAVAALGILMTVLNPLGAAFAAMGIAALSYTKKVNEQADALYKANQDLAKAGAVGAGGMTEIYDNLKKLGYGTEELAQMTELLKEHGQELSAFGGTAFQGAKRLAEVSDALKPMQNQFMNMGLSVDDINKGITGYIGLQNRLGKAQTRDAAELAKESGEYLRNMSMLSKLTGESADALQKKKEEALTIEAMYAAIENMPDDVQKLVTDKYAYIASKLGQDAATAFAKLTTGMASSEETQKINQRFGFAMGQVARNFNQPINEMAVQLQGGLKGAHAFNRSGAIFSDSMGDYGRYVAFMKQDTKTLQESVGVAGKAVKDQAAGADEATDEASKLRIQQMRTRTAMQDMLNDGILPVTKGLQGLSSVLNGVTGVGAQNQQKTSSTTSSTSTAPSAIASATGDKAALLNLIAKGESGGDYNALVYGQKGKKVDRTADLTNMTLAQVQEFQKGMIARGHESTAVGRYQFIASTLAEEIKKAGLDVNKTKFDAKTQDLLASRLIDQAGYGKKDTNTVINNLAGRWASLKNTSGTGQYNGLAGNKATIGNDELRAALTAPNSGLEITKPGADQSKLADNKAAMEKEREASWQQWLSKQAEHNERLIAAVNSNTREVRTGNDIGQQGLTYTRSL